MRVKQIGQDKADLPLRYDPSHPAANARRLREDSNVNSFVEVMDMREAQRSYSANLAVLQTTRSMLIADHRHAEMSRIPTVTVTPVRGGRGLCAGRPGRQTATRPAASAAALQRALEGAVEAGPRGGRADDEGDRRRRQSDRGRHRRVACRARAAIHRRDPRPRRAGVSGHHAHADLTSMSIPARRR